MTSPHSRRVKKWKRGITLLTLILPFLYAGFLIADHFGVWDNLTGLNLVKNVSDRFELSYAEGASRPVHVGDPEWEPTLAVIYRHSPTQLARDKEPKALARLRASLSVRTPPDGALTSEWTAPSTPMILFYVDWPTNEGKDIPPENYRIVGTIGDLKDWIADEKDRRRFIVQDVFFGTFGPLLAIVVFLLEKQSRSS